jgi:tetratricopeptide (TPR) repeat protein
LAKQAYQKALATNPNYAAALNNLAWVYCEHGGNLDEALSLAQRAKQIQPDEPNFSDTLGWIHYRKGLYGSAVELLKDAVRRAPGGGLFQYHLGMALLKTGRKDEARPALRRAIDLNLSATDAQQAKQTLQALAKPL